MVFSQQYELQLPASFFHRFFCTYTIDAFQGQMKDTNDYGMFLQN